MLEGVVVEKRLRTTVLDEMPGLC